MRYVFYFPLLFGAGKERAFCKDFILGEKKKLETKQYFTV